VMKSVRDVMVGNECLTFFGSYLNMYMPLAFVHTAPAL
jgi:hypothetical protein